MYTEDQAILDLIGHANEACAKAEHVINEKQAQAQVIEGMIPHVVKTLVDNERITPEHMDKCAEYLRDPVQALNIIEKLASLRNTIDNSRYSLGSRTKEASYRYGSGNSEVTKSKADEVFDNALFGG